VRVYLDDERPTPEGWTRVYTVIAAIALLALGEVTEISLDHDLADDHYGTDGPHDGTGYDVVLWLERKVRHDREFRMPKVTLHTQNPTGHARMLAGLQAIERYLQERRTVPV